MAPRKCSAASIFSVAKKRSAIIPTKNGEIMLASAVVPKIAPVSVPEKCRVAVRYVPMVTYHDSPDDIIQKHHQAQLRAARKGHRGSVIDAGVLREIPLCGH